MERTRVAIIGCGGIAQYHFSHFDKMLDKMQLVACSDLEADRMQKTAERFPGAKQYADYREMLNKENIDALFVAVPPYAHDGMEIMAIEKGIHLFCQKPMSLDLKYCKKVNAAIKKHKTISSVGLQCRYVDSFDFVKNYVDKKIRNNELASFSAYRYDEFPLVWWWREMDKSGGQVVEQAIHNYDLIRLLFGEVDQVSALRRRGVINDIEGHDSDDASSALIRFKNGIIGTFNTGCLKRPGFEPAEGEIKAFFRDGKLSYTIFGDYTIQDRSMTITGKCTNDYGQECDETFIDVVRGDLDRDEILTPYEDALKTLAFTFAVNESMDNDGAPVKPAF